MTAHFEFFPTHPDRILDPTFEIERKTLRDDLQDTTVLEIDSILTHIEGSIHIIFSDFESSNCNDTRTTSDLNMDS